VHDELFLRLIQVAFQQADYVAWNLWAAINNRPLLPFRCVLGCGTGTALTINSTEHSQDPQRSPKSVMSFPDLAVLGKPAADNWAALNRTELDCGTLKH
jgi:hypothetical protein